MSILKGILHHWNKTTQSYDTIHPETEVAQVTGWNQGIVNTLASTGLSSLVNVLSSDSLLALLIKKVFDAAGVKYSTGQNGYVSLGNFFGGVIVQWGYGLTSTSGIQKVTLPLSASALIGVASDRGVNPIYYAFNNETLTVYGRNQNGLPDIGAYAYIVICH